MWGDFRTQSHYFQGLNADGTGQLAKSLSTRVTPHSGALLERFLIDLFLGHLVAQIAGHLHDEASIPWEAVIVSYAAISACRFSLVELTVVTTHQGQRSGSGQFLDPAQDQNFPCGFFHLS
jgi:hypothetical protein